MSTTASDSGPREIVSGWIYDCGYRGTLDIIYGCVVVLIAAIWTVVHLNVPAKKDSDGRILWRRVRWGLVSIIAPDFLTLIAAAQWESAKKSVKQMKELTNTEGWTLVHAFYANSGGFVLETPDTETFPINADSVHYLVSRGYIPIPAISREEIWDKSKADVFAKGLALLQGVWIFVQAIARTSQKLPLTPIELFTLAFVISTAMSYFFWWRKPQHVGTPTHLSCETTMARIRADAGYSDDTVYVDTPMDFVEKPSQHWKRRPMFEDFDLESGARRMETTQVELTEWNQSSDQFGVENSSRSVLVNPETNVNESDAEQREMENKGLISPMSSRASTLVVPPKADHPQPTDYLKIEPITNLSTITVQTLHEKDKASLQENEYAFQTAISWTQSPRRRIPDDSIMAVRLPTKMVVLLLVPSLIHSSIHLAGWNHHFPTHTELILWRVCVILLAAMSSISVGAVRLLGITGYKGRYNLLWVWVNANADPRSRGVWDYVLATSTFLLILARLILIAQVCVSLRKLPADAFVDVDWANYIPHI